MNLLQNTRRFTSEPILYPTDRLVPIHPEGRVWDCKWNYLQSIDFPSQRDSWHSDILIREEPVPWIIVNWFNQVVSGFLKVALLSRLLSNIELGVSGKVEYKLEQSAPPYRQIFKYKIKQYSVWKNWTFGIDDNPKNFMAFCVLLNLVNFYLNQAILSGNE